MENIHRTCSHDIFFFFNTKLFSTDNIQVTAQQNQCKAVADINMKNINDYFFCFWS